MNLFFTQHRERNSQQLEKILSNDKAPSRLLEAMRYSTLSTGKQFRALLVYAAGKSVNAEIEPLDYVAAAVECIHSYSLIHDDLPSMDDDDLRRGKASNHMKFDEATAILAGDALLTLAFEIINCKESHLTDKQCRTISSILANSAGQTGMVGGQMLDIIATDKQLNRDQLENMHSCKTGALIEAAVLCGAHCNELTDQNTLNNLLCYASSLGLAYQVIDDVLDIESNTETLGKPSGSDLAHNKATFPALIGLDGSKELALNLYNQAIASADSIGDNSQHLIALAALVINRNH